MSKFRPEKIKSRTTTKSLMLWSVDCLIEYGLLTWCDLSKAKKKAYDKAPTNAAGESEEFGYLGKVEKQKNGGDDDEGDGDEEEKLISRKIRPPANRRTDDANTLKHKNINIHITSSYFRVLCEMFLGFTTQCAPKTWLVSESRNLRDVLWLQIVWPWARAYKMVPYNFGDFQDPGNSGEITRLHSDHFSGRPDDGGVRCSWWRIGRRPGRLIIHSINQRRTKAAQLWQTIASETVNNPDAPKTREFLRSDHENRMAGKKM